MEVLDMENQEVFEELTVEPETPVEEVKEKKAVKPAHPLSGPALVLSILCCWFAPQMGLLSIGSLIMSICAMIDSKKKDYGAKGMNLAALIVSIVSIVLHVITWLSIAFLVVLYILFYGVIIAALMNGHTEYADPIYGMMMY